MLYEKYIYRLYYRLFSIPFYYYCIYSHSIRKRKNVVSLRMWLKRWGTFHDDVFLYYLGAFSRCWLEEEGANKKNKIHMQVTREFRTLTTQIQTTKAKLTIERNDREEARLDNDGKWTL